MRLHIGIDDTDSPDGMCTTYLGALLYREISRVAEPLDLPKLIRLNPNVPYKTRGNGAVAMSFEVEDEEIPKIKEFVLKMVEELSDFNHENTNPGVVFLEGELPKELEEFTYKAIWEHVTIEDAEKVAREVNAEIHKFKLGRGIIGALAAVGHPLKNFTYELLAYRKREFWGKERRVNRESVFEADRLTYPFTYDNVDPFKGSVLITPHGKDPVLVGIRGIDKNRVLWAFENLIIEEPVEFFQIYKTNQNTDEHLRFRKIGELKPLESAVVRGRVSREYWEKGRHVFFELSDETSTIRVAAFEPTKGFRRYVRMLIEGDEIIAAGGVKEFEGVLTLNLEKFYPIRLAEKIVYEKPKCPKCGGTMKSKGDYLKCKKCGHKMPKVLIPKRLPRQLEKKIYEVPPDARKHLSRPLVLPLGEKKILEAAERN
ncbi:tRNA(Ile2) 2-agmatinylcytidine synthetase TiaS [Thermococcus alcaliphilus]|uniref:tRNA(Ile2) 2-agmatinylcytidine synthetase TiaS n=1 Tax=Thermococcus alcaliphilus TaxID=139207 RepID=UPI002091112C|nr:tRNA(Ile2) 2-agmatinylcytidine synthetase TiaS [Thermococcus alcaliphilus]MCO6040936.1 tRNA(Ile2) 2-agmatinylcytidine synthetase TiaS [Thermococcus alcaliphilus]